MNIQPLDNYLISVENKYVEEIITSSGVKFFLDPSWNPTMHTTVIGKVEKIPVNNSLELSIGDSILFSYVVIGQRDYASTGSVFHSMFEGEVNPMFQRYKNGKGEFLNIKAMSGIIGYIWTGVHLSPRSELIDGCQGSESEVSRWASKFQIGAGGSYKYKNLLNIEGKEYWVCKPEYVFAKKDGKKLIPLSDRLILNPINVEIPKDVLSEMMIKVPESSVFARYYDRGELTHPDKTTGYKKGDIVGFDPKFVERYDVDGKEQFLLRKRRVLGKYSKFQVKN